MTKDLAFGQNYSSAGGHRPVRRPSTWGGVLVTVGYAHGVRWQSYPWAVGFFFGNTELSLEFWTVISGVDE